MELSVADTGPGIALGILERMFEPFFSTKQTGKGSGMGLSTVHGIIHEHRGHIVVDSVPGEGAVFRILFQAMGQENHKELGPAPTSSANSRRDQALIGHVLVVDDEPSVAELMKELLESWGLRVTVKTSSLEAQATFVRDPKQFDLVLTDQVMPGLTGIALAQRLLNIRPELPIILYTAFSDHQTEHQVKACGIRALIKKPVNFEETFAAIKQALLGPDEH